MRIFKIMTITIIAITIVFAGCKRGNDTTKPEVEPTTKPTTTNITQATKPSTDLGTLANYFATKKYAGDTKQYTIDDIIAPKKIISALTNTKISYIKLLRNEILARRGYVFKSEKEKLHGLEPEVIKEILQPTKWYSSNSDFIYADLTKIEIANVSFLKKLEKIDLIGGERARQLPVVLDMDKLKINTYEALKVYRATKKADVLTTLSKEIILFKTEAKHNYKQFVKTPVNEDEKRGGYLFSSRINTAKFIINFKVGDRMLIDSKGDMLLVECLTQMTTNFEWDIAELGAGVSRAAPKLKIYDIQNDMVKLTNEFQYWTVKITDKMRNDLYPFAVPDLFDYTPSIRYKGDYIFPIGLDGGESAFDSDANHEELFNYYYFWTKKRENSLYVLVPFEIKSEALQLFYGYEYGPGYRYYPQAKELYEYAKEKDFLSGLNIFKITILK